MAEFAETTKAPRKNNGALSSTLPLSDVFFMTLKHWQWILLSVIVFVGGAYLYLLPVSYKHMTRPTILRW